MNIENKYLEYLIEIFVHIYKMAQKQKGHVKNALIEIEAGNFKAAQSSLSKALNIWFNAKDLSENPVSMPFEPWQIAGFENILRDISYELAMISRNGVYAEEYSDYYDWLYVVDTIVQEFYGRLVKAKNVVQNPKRKDEVKGILGEFLAKLHALEGILYSFGKL